MLGASPDRTVLIIATIANHWPLAELTNGIGSGLVAWFDSMPSHYERHRWAINIQFN